MVPKVPVALAKSTERNPPLIRRSSHDKKPQLEGQIDDYSSHGVKDNDIFLLPGSDFQLLGVLTVLAAAVRLFRIYQPSSVVFDEVQ